MTIYKDMTIPFEESQMEAIGEIDNNIYIINYEKSSIKGIAFIDYLTVLSKICDISDYQNIDTKTKFEMMNRLYHQPEFIFLPVMGRSLSLIMLEVKGIKVDDKEYENSFLTRNEVKQYIDDNIEYINKYITFFDSLFVFMLMLSKLIINQKDIEEKDIDKLYEGIEEDNDSIMPTVCNVLFDPIFYNYYEKDVDDTHIKYYKRLYTQRLYNGKTIVPVIMNEANTIIRKLLFALGEYKSAE